MECLCMQLPSSWPPLGTMYYDSGPDRRAAAASEPLLGYGTTGTVAADPDRRPTGWVSVISTLDLSR
jgi:hypothetical protein